MYRYNNQCYTEGSCRQTAAMYSAPARSRSIARASVLPAPQTSVVVSPLSLLLIIISSLIIISLVLILLGL